MIKHSFFPTTCVYKVLNYPHPPSVGLELRDIISLT